MGQGYATEAARACLADGFERLGLVRVSAFTERANIRSVRVIEKPDMQLVRTGTDGVPAWAEYVIDRATERPGDGPVTPAGRDACPSTRSAPRVRRPPHAG